MITVTRNLNLVGCAVIVFMFRRAESVCVILIEPLRASPHSCAFRAGTPPAGNFPAKTNCRI